MEAAFKILSLSVSSFFSLLKVVLRSSFFLKKYKSTSDTIYILGNGPSFKKDYLKYQNQLANKTLLTVNGFPLTKAFSELRPANFIICSPGFYNDKAVDYNVSVRANIIDALITKTTWPLNFFLPASARRNNGFIDKIEQNNNIRICYYNTTPVEGLYPISRLLLSAGLSSPRPHNVLIPSILQAIISGYKKIYLLGADHSWLPQITVNENNEVLINQKHFYDENSSTPKQMHKNEGQSNRHLHEVLQKFYYSFESYHLLDRFAKDNSCKVINLTSGSFIDGFEREECERHFL